jgi:hypothetical protein
MQKWCYIYNHYASGRVVIAVVLKDKGFSLAISLVCSPVYYITEYCEIETEVHLNYLVISLVWFAVCLCFL